MSSYIISSLIGYTNYSIQNTNNIYNCLITILSISSNEQKRQIIDTIRLQIGKTFCDDFKLYIFNKIPNSELLNFF